MIRLVIVVAVGVEALLLKVSMLLTDTLPVPLAAMAKF